jgi:hypothetical protein
MDQGGIIVLKLIFGLVGLMLFVFAYLIGVKKKVTLIAGYNPEKVKDEAGLARFAGVMTTIFGLVVILFPWIYGPERTTPLRWLLYFAVPVVIFVVVMIIGTSRYERTPGDRAEG